MRFFVMYLVMLYIVACADSVDDHNDSHEPEWRVLRAVVWPVTVSSWFITQNVRLHRLLNILWAVLISGWLLSLLADRL